MNASDGHSRKLTVGGVNSTARHKECDLKLVILMVVCHSGKKTS